MRFQLALVQYFAFHLSFVNDAVSKSDFQNLNLVDHLYLVMNLLGRKHGADYLELRSFSGPSLNSY